eukprot:jgi/Botrbrau1/728/Bobra.160_2s0051.1
MLSYPGDRSEGTASPAGTASAGLDTAPVAPQHVPSEPAAGHGGRTDPKAPGGPLGFAEEGDFMRPSGTLGTEALRVLEPASSWDAIGPPPSLRCSSFGSLQDASDADDAGLGKRPARGSDCSPRGGLNLSLDPSGQQFLDKGVEALYRETYASWHMKRDLAVLSLMVFAVCSVHFGPPFYLGQYQGSLYWTGGMSSAVIVFYIYPSWYKERRDWLLLLFCSAGRFQVVWAAANLRHIPEHQAMMAERWLYAIPLHYALETVFLVRDLWVRAVLLAIALLGVAVSYSDTNTEGWPNPLIYQIAARVIFAEAASLAVQRMWEAQSRQTFVQSMMLTADRTTSDNL